MTDRAPFVDPNLEFISISKIRALNRTTVQDLRRPLVIVVDGHLVAAIIPMEYYYQMQDLATNGVLGPTLEMVQKIGIAVGESEEA